MDDKYEDYQYEIIRKLTAAKDKKKYDIHAKMERRVNKLLREAEIPTRVKGYNYLCSAIMLVIYDPDIIHYMMTELYVQVAEQYHTTASRVERAMRFALTRGWDNLYSDEDENKDWDIENKPSNSEFITTIAEKVKTEFKFMSKPRYTPEEYFKKHNK